MISAVPDAVFTIRIKMVERKLLCLIGILILSISTTETEAKRRGKPGIKGGELGDDCEYDDDCPNEHMYCRLQKVCECKNGYTPGFNGDNCVAIIGTKCKNHIDCSGTENVECAEEVCACKKNHVRHPTEQTTCLLATTTIGGDCLESVQCSVFFGNRSSCIDGKCRCMPLHHESDGTCIRSSGLNEKCTNSGDCHVSDDDDSLNKEVECIEGTCQCAPGYHVAGATCTDGANQLVSLSLISVMLVYALAQLLH